MREIGENIYVDLLVGSNLTVYLAELLVFCEADLEIIMSVSRLVGRIARNRSLLFCGDKKQRKREREREREGEGEMCALVDIDQICGFYVGYLSKMEITVSFKENQLVRCSLRIIYSFIQNGVFGMQDFVDAFGNDSEIMLQKYSPAVRNLLKKFRSFGWLIRFLEHRDARVSGYWCFYLFFVLG